MHYIPDDRYESAVARVQAAALSLNPVTGEPCIDALKIALADVFGIVPEGVREDDEKDQPEADEDEADFIEGGPFPSQPAEFVPMTPGDERWIREG